MDSREPYAEWPPDAHGRWLAAANAFGRHLMAAARDYAIERIPANATANERELARSVTLDALYGMMTLLDGIADSHVGPDHIAEYVLLSRVRSSQTGTVVEQFELSPDGDGLCMGYHGWVARTLEGRTESHTTLDADKETRSKGSR